MSSSKSLSSFAEFNQKDNPERVEEVPSGLEGVPIWMDTFCIPVEEQYSELRKLSIMKMREIYKEASSVLVVDGEIRQLSKQVSRIEFVYRFILSSWEQRLWTFQEGYLAKNIEFLACDGAISCSSILFSSSEKRLQTSVINTAIDRMKLRFTYSKSSSARTSVVIVLKLLENRTTSKRENEIIVLANILNVPNGPLQQTRDPEVEMIIFLQTLDKTFGIPLADLFGRGRRLYIPGFRWAPVSFVSPAGISSTPSPENFAQLSAAGLFLTFEHPSIEITGQADLPLPGFGLVIPAQRKSVGEYIGVRYELESSAPFWIDNPSAKRKMVILPESSTISREVLLEVIHQLPDGRFSARYCCCVTMFTRDTELMKPELRGNLAKFTFRREPQPPRRWITD